MSSHARRLARDIAAAPTAAAALDLLRRARHDQIHVTACLHRMAALSYRNGPELQELLSYMEPKSLNLEMLAINSWSLAKLHQAETEDFRQQLLLLAVQRRSELSARHLSNLLWSTASCTGTTVPEVVWSLAEELPRKIQDMSPQGLANCFWALSKLTGAIDSHLVEVVVAEVEMRINELNAPDLASIIWSVAAFAGLHRAVPLLGVLAGPTLTLAVQLSSRQLTNIAWAMATVSPDSTQTVVQALVEEALSRPPSARDVPNLCWSLAAVRGVGPSMLTETIQGVIGTPTVGMLWALCVTEAPGVGPLLMAGVQDGSFDALVSSETSETAPQLVQLLWCQATSRGNGPELLLATTERVEELCSLDLSRCAWACAVLESERAATTLALRVASHMTDNTTTTPATVVQVCWSLSRLQLYVPRLLEQLTSCKELRAQDLALAAWVLAFWHFVGEGCLLTEMDAHHRDLQDFGAQDLANVAWAMAIQVVKPEPLMLALAVEAQRKISSLEPQHLCNLIWAFTTISWSVQSGDRKQLIWLKRKNLKIAKGHG